MSDEIDTTSVELKPPVLADDKLPRSVKAVYSIRLFAALVMTQRGETTLSVQRSGHDGGLS